MKKLVKDRFKGYEKFAEDGLKGTKFSQNKIRGVIVLKKIRSRKNGYSGKMLRAPPPLNRCPALNGQVVYCKVDPGRLLFRFLA